MQQFIGFGFAALTWGVVCFAFGWVVAISRRLAEENTLLRSTVSALSNEPRPRKQSVPDQQSAVSAQAESSPEQTPVPASELSSAPPAQPQSVAPSQHAPTVTLQPQPSLARKVYLFGEPHAERSAPPAHPAQPAQTSSGWPDQHHGAPLHITAGETDLLPRLPQRRREHLRRR